MPDAAATWSGEDVAPGDVEEALRHLLQEQYARDGAHAPARVLNLVVVIDREWRGEIMNRLEQVGRYHASRTILCTRRAAGARRSTRRCVMTVEGDAARDELALMRERVVLEVGEKHLTKLDTIVDPLVVTDLQTLVWSPHGHPEAVDALLHLAQVVLIDSVNEPDAAAALRRAKELSRGARTSWTSPGCAARPWRERVAATFDPPRCATSCARIDSVTIRHHPTSRVAGVLFFGWLALAARLAARAR